MPQSQQIYVCHTWIPRTATPPLPTDLHLISFAPDLVVLCGARRAVEDWAEESLYSPPEPTTSFACAAAHEPSW